MRRLGLVLGALLLTLAGCTSVPGRSSHRVELPPRPVLEMRARMGPCDPEPGVCVLLKRADVQRIVEYLLTLEREVCAAGAALGAVPPACPD